jgi:hypothetical protein
MSEQGKPKSYMQQLDDWAEVEVIGPLINPLQADPSQDHEATVAQVKKAIREKVLESYHNGQAAAPAKAYKRPSYAKR